MSTSIKCMVKGVGLRVNSRFRAVPAFFNKVVQIAI